VTTRRFAKLGGHTDGALVDDVRKLQGREATGVLVKFRESAEIQVAKTLMPQHAKSRAAEGVDEEHLVERGASGRELREDERCGKRRSDGRKEWEVIRRRGDEGREGIDDETMRAAREGSDLGIRRRDEKRLSEDEATA
jgi:hypothetical protein